MDAVVTRITKRSPLTPHPSPLPQGGEGGRMYLSPLSSFSLVPSRERIRVRGKRCPGCRGYAYSCVYPSAQPFPSRGCLLIHLSEFNPRPGVENPDGAATCRSAFKRDGRCLGHTPFAAKAVPTRPNASSGGDSSRGGSGEKCLKFLGRER